MPAIANKKGGLLSRFGINFGAETNKRDLAIAIENLRFERELVQLRKEYQDRPDELEKLARAATELNRVSLSQIENQFKSLGKTVEDIFISSTQRFFTDKYTLVEVTVRRSLIGEDKSPPNGKMSLDFEQATAASE